MLVVADRCDRELIEAKPKVTIEGRHQAYYVNVTEGRTSVLLAAHENEWLVGESNRRIIIHRSIHDCWCVTQHAGQICSSDN